jgi:drug/metabolite transporter (DMT)-like permease
LLRIAGILFGLAGILLVLLPGQSLPEPGMAPWLLMAFGAPLCFAIGTVCVAILRPPESRPIPLVKPPFYVPLPDRVSGTGGRMFRVRRV